MLDPQLRALLISELGKHVAAIANEADDGRAAGRALHAAKGAAGVAGERALSEALARIERRFRGGEAEALLDARELLAQAIVNLQAGQHAWRDPWPQAPADLHAAVLPPENAERYVPEMRDRVRAIDEAIASTGDQQEALQAGFRHVHTMKGAALAVGDELLAWFCHGLEERVRPAVRGDAPAAEAMAELVRWRAVLAQLVDEPARALATLRAISLRPATSRASEPPAAHPESTAPIDAWLRVPGAALDRVLERMGRLAAFGSEFRSRAEEARELSRSLRASRAALVEAQRLIGPPRPWGAPAAAIANLERVASSLADDAERLERQSLRSKQQAHSVREDLASTHADLGAMRQASMSFVFEPARAAVEALAHREGRLVRVTVAGAAVPLDRRLAEALIDPVLQLARNAVAHGIEPPAQRSAAGKPDVGSVTLRALMRGTHLVVSVEDDGAGVDVEAVRREAAGTGVIAPELAEQADDDTLIELLFTPGLTTHGAPDVLAGRGVGLDLVQQVVRRFGGTVRVTNHPGRGFAASLELPLIARGLVPVLWVESAGRAFALAAASVLCVRCAETPSDDAAPPLARCLDPDASPHFEGDLVVVFGSEQAAAGVPVRIERVGKIERVAARPTSPLVALAGPYAGVIVTHTGAPALLVDGAALVGRMRGRASRSVAPPPLAS